MIDEDPLPHSAEAELSVIGSMILDPDVIRDVADILVAEDFYIERNRLTWEAIHELSLEGSPTDVVSVSHRLTRHNTLNRVGGRDALVTAMESVTTPASARHHARIVRESAQLRAMRSAGKELFDGASRLAANPDEVLLAVEQQIASVRGRDRGSLVIAQDIMVDVIEDVASRKDRPDGAGMPTGIFELDQMIGGLKDGRYYVIGARPSMGKSCLMNKLAVQAAMRQGRRPLIFSLEVSAEQVIENHVIALSGVDSMRFSRGELSDHEWSAVNQAMEDIKNAEPIVIHAEPRMKIEAIDAITRREIARRGVGAVFVDHMHIMDLPKAETSHKAYSIISGGFQGLARETNVPLVVLAQLSRGVEAREDHRPRMSDLRETGSIEEDADVIALLYRDAYYADKENRAIPPERASVADLIISKNRGGPTGSVPLHFQRECLRFSGLAPQSQNPVAGSYNRPIP